MTVNTQTTRCYVCNEPINPGERREADAPHGRSRTRHWAPDSVEDGPGGALGTLEPMDYFDVRFNGGDWLLASVEGVNACGNAFDVRAVLRTEKMANAPPTPLEHTDQFKIVITPREDGWTDPEAFEIVPDWDAMDASSGDSFISETHQIGEVEVRPAEEWADE